MNPFQNCTDNLKVDTPTIYLQYVFKCICDILFNLVCGFRKKKEIDTF